MDLLYHRIARQPLLAPPLIRPGLYGIFILLDGRKVEVPLRCAFLEMRHYSCMYAHSYT